LVGRHRSDDEFEARSERQVGRVRQKRRRAAHAPPELLKPRSRLVLPAVDHACGHQHRVDRAGAGAADRVKGDVGLLQQPVEDAPGESAERAAALQGERQLARRPLRGAIRKADEGARSVDEGHRLR